MVAALERPNGDARLRELFAARPQASEVLATYLEPGASVLATPRAAPHHLATLRTLRAAGVLPEARVAALEAQAERAIVEANRSGALPFTLDDPLDELPMLQHGEPHRLVVARTVEQLVNGGGRPLRGFVQYVQHVGADSAEGRKLVALLPQMNVRRSEIDLVAPIAQTFAARRRAELTTHAVLVVEGDDHFVRADLLGMIAPQTPGIKWSEEPDPQLPTVTVERTRYEERSLPQRSQTLLYPAYDIDPFYAHRRFSPHASYVVDIVHGGREIQYSYVVTVHTGGAQTQRSTVQGSVKSEERRCDGPRMQYGYGYGSGYLAGFHANPDLTTRCRNDAGESMDELRKRVLDEIAREIMQVPFVKHSLDMQ